MNTRQIECFMSVAEHLNFTKAAGELYLSVPTVTHHIQSLEDEVGEKLFERSKRTVRLTKAGETFLYDAQAMYDIYRLALRRVHDGRNRPMRIGCTSRFQFGELGVALRHFRNEYPGVLPGMTIADHGRLIGLLRNREIDIMFGSEYMVRGEDDLKFHFVNDQVSYVLMSDKHPLAQMGAIALDDIKDEKLVYVNRKPVPLQSDNPVKQILAMHTRDHRDIKCDEDVTCLTLVAAGYGIAILPAYRIPFAELGVYSLKAVPVAEANSFGYGFVTLTEPEHHITDFVSVYRGVDATFK